MEEPTKIFKVLSDINRLRTLKMLQLRPLCVCEITEILGLAASTVSQHLSLLKKAGFIYEERDGKWVNYVINSRAEDARVSSILSTLDFWIGDIELVRNDLAKVKTINRFEVCSK